MYNFFIEKENICENTVTITGKDFNHIKNVLRMRVGEQFLVSVNNVAKKCEILEFTDGAVIANVVDDSIFNTDPPVKIYLFQGLPKSDKMELIVQKAVELGAEEIIPVQMKRCVVKLDGKKIKEKTTRWQAIAESAGKQSKRTHIPTVVDAMDYKKAVEYAKSMDLILLPYENKDGMQSLKNALTLIKKDMRVAIFIGSEGGFDDTEVALAENAGAKTVSLGKRILRTETAAIISVGTVALYAEATLE